MTDRTIALLALVLTAIGGALILVDLLGRLARGLPRGVDSSAELLAVALALVFVALAALWMVRGRSGREAGILAIVGGVLAVLFDGDAAGALALVGGVLGIVAVSR